MGAKQALRLLFCSDNCMTLQSQYILNDESLTHTAALATICVHELTISINKYRCSSKLIRLLFCSDNCMTLQSVYTKCESLKHIVALAPCSWSSSHELMMKKWNDEPTDQLNNSIKCMTYYRLVMIHIEGWTKVELTYDHDTPQEVKSTKSDRYTNYCAMIE